MKDEFLATLSHELSDDRDSATTRKFDEATAARALETIDRNTKSLAQLIEDVLYRALLPVSSALISIR